MIFFHDSPILEVNLDSIVRNWRLLSSRFSGKTAGAVVKANGYGLGADEISRALYAAGCRDFFVATLDEAIALKPDVKEARLFVFHGVGEGEEKEFIAHKLLPVLNNSIQIERWSGRGEGKPSALHVDTGMNRLGISLNEAQALANDVNLLQRLNLTLLLSHLSCAGDPHHPQNAQQLVSMQQMKKIFPSLPVSFANSSGIFLPEDFHFDLARPGCALYGITPNLSLPNPMEHVVELSVPILQIREITQDMPVGYGCTYTAKQGARIATLAIGYADGYFRNLGSKGYGICEGIKVPIVGRISMDMITVDISAVPLAQLTPKSRITLIGKRIPVDEVAQLAGTIGYEIFTRLGQRIRRVYVEDGQKS